MTCNNDSKHIWCAGVWMVLNSKEEDFRIDYSRYNKDLVDAVNRRYSARNTDVTPDLAFLKFKRKGGATQ